MACADGSELFCNPKERPDTEMHCLGQGMTCNRAKWFASPWTSVSTSTTQKIKRLVAMCKVKIADIILIDNINSLHKSSFNFKTLYILEFQIDITIFCN